MTAEIQTTKTKPEKAKTRVKIAAPYAYVEVIE